MASYRTQGVPPKPPSKRRRANVPKSYGEAVPVTAPAAADVDVRDLGIENPHPLITSMWNTVAESCEAAFYGEADWVRLRMELWYVNATMAGGQPSANWAMQPLVAAATVTHLARVPPCIQGCATRRSSSGC